MLCCIVDGPLVQITIEVLIMKQKNENESDSAAYKSQAGGTAQLKARTEARKARKI